MTIEIALLISVVSVIFGVYNTVSVQRRARKTEAQNDATQMTSLMVKLESVNTSILKLETKIDNFEGGMRDVRDRGIINEQSIKSLHKRVDAFENKIKEIESK